MWGLLRRSEDNPAGQIVGPTVVLRRPTFSDFQQWAALRGSSRAFLEPWEPRWDEDALSRQSYRDRVSRIGREWSADLGYGFHIFTAKDGKLLGGVNLTNVRRGAAQAANLGYWVGEPHANRGHMGAALAILLPDAFRRLNLHRVDAACIPDNGPSRHLLTKFGFQQIGVARDYLKIDGRWRDHLLHCLTYDDLLAAPAMRNSSGKKIDQRG